jgi:hypothetical protein
MDPFPLALRQHARSRRGTGVRDTGRGEAARFVDGPLWRMRTTDEVRAAAVIACISGPGHDWMTRLFRRTKCRRCGVFR